MAIRFWMLRRSDEMTSRRTWWVIGFFLTTCVSVSVRAETTAIPESPAVPAASSALPASSPAASEATSDNGSYSVRLKALERNVNDLKEQVFRTRARLNLLKETVLGGVIGASRCVIKHKNEMGATFRLIRVVYALDGVQIMNKVDDSGRLAEMTEFDVYNGAIQPGNHTLSVQLVYQGHGFGVFSYLKGYKFKASSSHTFIAADNKATIVTVLGYEKPGITTNVEDKPAVEFKVNLVSPEGTGSSSVKN
jgi:hypothetical protein